jgi:hypothetical protein
VGIRSLRCAVAMACVVGSACAPSLVAVRATANIGTGLGAYEGAFDAGVTYCKDGNVGSPTPDPACARLEKDLASWHAVNHTLVAYAAALLAMADDTKDKVEKDDITTALTAASLISPTWGTDVNGNVIAGGAQGVTSLLLGIEGVYRRERLASTIAASDAAVTAIVAALDKNIDVLDRAEKNVQQTVADTITAIQAGTSPAADKHGMTILLTAVVAEIAAHRGTLSNYKKTADSFATAHFEIKKKLHGLGDHKADLELLKVIALDIKDIVKNAELARQTP